MFHQIPWQTYAISIVTLLILYYGYVAVFFFRTELSSFYLRLTGKQPAAEFNTLIPAPEYDIMGAAKPDSFPDAKEAVLEFGPSDNPDELPEEEPAAALVSAFSDSRLIGPFSEMISEVKTLIRVINESVETRENFEMLFKLIVQKYPELKGTAHQHQVTEFLIEEGAGQFPFDITPEELEDYWKS
jgi:hypothetical protein